MPDFPVSPEKVADLYARLAKLGITESDLDESFIRSGGAGGQNVNKVSTCVVLIHRSTGTTVRCQQERSQALNRFVARRLLASKLEEKILGVLSDRQKLAEKIRRTKRKRSRNAKEKMLKNKRFHSNLKAGRRDRGHNE